MRPTMPAVFGRPLPAHHPWTLHVDWRGRSDWHSAPRGHVDIGGKTACGLGLTTAGPKRVTKDAAQATCAKCIRRTVPGSDQRFMASAIAWWRMAGERHPPAWIARFFR